MTGVTLDTGFLVALERRKERAASLLRLFAVDRIVLTVPAVVLAEWWRGSDVQARIRARRLFVVEPMIAVIAEIAGGALARVKGAQTNDAIVMASAARRDDVVYTADFEDLDRLRDQHFRGVKVLAI